MVWSDPDKTGIYSGGFPMDKLITMAHHGGGGGNTKKYSGNSGETSAAKKEEEKTSNDGEEETSDNDEKETRDGTSPFRMLEGFVLPSWALNFTLPDTEWFGTGTTKDGAKEDDGETQVKVMGDSLMDKLMNHIRVQPELEEELKRRTMPKQRATEGDADQREEVEEEGRTSTVSDDESGSSTTSSSSSSTTSSSSSSGGSSSESDSDDDSDSGSGSDDSSMSDKSDGEEEDEPIRISVKTAPKEDVHLMGGKTALNSSTTKIRIVGEDKKSQTDPKKGESSKSEKKSHKTERIKIRIRAPAAFANTRSRKKLLRF